MPGNRGDPGLAHRSRAAGGSLLPSPERRRARPPRQRSERHQRERLHQHGLLHPTERHERLGPPHLPRWRPGSSLQRRAPLSAGDRPVPRLRGLDRRESHSRRTDLFGARHERKGRHPDRQRGARPDGAAPDDDPPPLRGGNHSGGDRRPTRGAGTDQRRLFEGARGQRAQRWRIDQFRRAPERSHFSPHDPRTAGVCGGRPPGSRASRADGQHRPRRCTGVPDDAQQRVYVRGVARQRPNQHGSHAAAAPPDGRGDRVSLRGRRSFEQELFPRPRPLLPGSLHPGRSRGCRAVRLHQGGRLRARRLHAHCPPDALVRYVGHRSIGGEFAFSRRPRALHRPSDRRADVNRRVLRHGGGWHCRSRL